MKRTAIARNPESARAMQNRAQAKARDKARQPQTHEFHGKGIAKRSPKLSREQAKYSILRGKMLAQYPECWHCLELGQPPKRATEIHHVCGRERHYLNLVELFMPVAAICHNEIENNEEWAKDHGWKISRHLSYERQIEVLMELRGGFSWVKETVTDAIKSPHSG